MAAIDTITDLAQSTYFSVNGSENDDTGTDLTEFQDNFIRAFNLWLDEYETETYWNKARVDDYVLGTVTNITTYSFELDSDYRTPVIDENKYLKFITDGIVIAKFKMVDPNQRQVDDDLQRPDRATFVEENKIVLSRVPTAAELGAKIVLDVVKRFPKLTRTNASAIDMIYSKQLAVLGIAKNNTLSDVTKVSLSPSFTQKYSNELNKALNVNNASNEIDDMRGENYGNIGGIW